MPDNVLDRERLLREEIARDLPDFVRACEEQADFVVMHQDAFTPALGSTEIFLLGKAIKYAGLVGKEVRIIPSSRRPS
jgi:hypothetical protein